MAKSGELKVLIVAQIKEEWADPEKGGDWKEGVTEETFTQMCKPKNWKRFWKGRGIFGKGTKDDDVIRQFGFVDEDSGVEITATVACDKNDNFKKGIEIETVQ